MPPFGLDPIGGRTRRLVFPHVQDAPPQAGERGVLGSVAGNVAVELGTPPIPVVARQRAVVGAAVPEASVDEDRDFRSGECKVWATGKPWVVHTEPQAAAV